jgi:hypothetical protein
MEEKFLKKSITTVSRLERRKYLANVFTELQRSIIRILSYGASVVVMVYLGYRIQGALNLAGAAFLYQLCTSISNNLIDAFPARWTGPTLDVTANNAAIEVLEIAHNGFIGQ